MTERTPLRGIAQSVYATLDPIEWRIGRGCLVSPVVDLGSWGCRLEIHPTGGGVLLPRVKVYQGDYVGSFIALNPLGHASALLRIFHQKFRADEENRRRILATVLGID